MGFAVINNLQIISVYFFLLSMVKKCENVYSVFSLRESEFAKLSVIVHVCPHVTAALKRACYFIEYFYHYICNN